MLPAAPITPTAPLPSGQVVSQVAPHPMPAQAPGTTGQQPVARGAVQSAAHPALSGEHSQVSQVSQLGHTQRKLHEPAFVSHHDITLEPEPMAPPHSSRWPILVGGVLGLAAIVVGAIIAVSRDNEPPAPPPRHSVDAGIVAQRPIDAAAIAELPAEAGVPDDAAVADAKRVRSRACAWCGATPVSTT